MKLFISLLTCIFISSCSFFDETACEWNMVVKKGLWHLPNEVKPFTGNNICVNEKGIIIIEGKIKNGEYHGHYIRHYNIGRIWDEREYDMGILTGKHTRWYYTPSSDNDQKRFEGEYVKGKRHGIWYDWHSNGIIWMITKYDKGVIIDRYQADR